MEWISEIIAKLSSDSRRKSAFWFLPMRHVSNRYLDEEIVDSAVIDHTDDVSDNGNEARSSFEPWNVLSINI